MLRIGLAGVQGAGKSILAKDLKTALEKTGEYKSVKIIDDYIPEIAEETDLAMGFYATYIGNVYAALGRATKERLAVSEGHDVIITCGTVFETASYMARQLEAEFKFLKDEEKEDHLRRAEASMKFVSCLYVDTVKYDYIFHLPRITNPSDDAPETDVAELDKALVVAFDSFKLFPTTRIESEGDNIVEISENRVKKALEVIGENKS